MKNKEALSWFLETFGQQLERAVVGTPFSAELLAAIAFQETGYIWGRLKEAGLELQEILKLCVGDTIDEERGRSAFPRTSEELIAVPRGAEMFQIAREALMEVAEYIMDYAGAARTRHKFCHGFGIFQYDIQFFRTDPEFFLQRKWEDFDACVGRCVWELLAALHRQGWRDREWLSDRDQTYVAIANNAGHADLSMGIRQGHRSDDGRYYGENIWEYLCVAKSLGRRPASQPAGILAAFSTEPVRPEEELFVVSVQNSPLCLRSEPRISAAYPGANVIGRLRDGQIVRRISGKPTDPFLEVEASVKGFLCRGYAASKYLVGLEHASVGTSVQDASEVCVGSARTPDLQAPVCDSGAGVRGLFP